MAGLVADYASESESDSDSESSDEGSSTSRTMKLPKPILGLPKPELEPGSGISMKERSVFLNPFVEADNAKIAILEKHVKMISTDVKTVNGKKICWNYRKNKCRFGHNCKYAHDSDLQVDPKAVPEKNIQQIDPSKVITSEVDTNTLSKGKKRPGLSQNLVPSKKIMKSYHQQKAKNK